MASARYSRYYTYIKPISQNKFVKSSTPYIFSIITVTIMLVFALRPTISTVSNLQKSIENNKQVLEQLNIKSANLSEAKKNLDSLSSENTVKINTAFPQKAEVTALLSNLKNSAVNGATISALQVTDAVTIMDDQINNGGPSMGEIKFTFNIQGSYSQVIRTLENLKRSPRVISIDSIILNKQKEGAILLVVNGKGYFLK